MKWYHWLLIVVIVSAVAIYQLNQYLEPSCPLARFGLDYRIEGGASPTYDPIVFYLKDNPAKIKCPIFDGFQLHLRFADLDGDGIEEIIVTCDDDPRVSSVVKVLIKDGRVTGFRVLKDENLDIIFFENSAEPASPTP